MGDILGRQVAQILNMADQTPRDFLRAYAAFLEILDDAGRFITENGNFNKQDYTHLINRIDNIVVQMNSSTPITFLVQNLNSHDFTMLKMTSDLYTQIGNEENVGDEIINEYIEKIESFISEIEQDISEPNLKKILTSNLYLLKDALLQYRYRGSKHIEAITERLLISFFRHRETINSEAKTHSIVVNLFNVLSKLDSIISISTGVPQLLNQLPATDS
jgi:hypothetical protein